MTTTKKTNYSAAYPYAAMRDNCAMLKAMLDATERNYFSMLDRANSATATKTDRAALADAAEKYAVAAVRFAWSRVDSTTGRALDSFGARAADLELSEKQRAAAADSGCNAVIFKLRNETTAAVKSYLLSMVDQNAADNRAAAYLSDVMDILSAAVLSIFETAADRNNNRAAAAAESIGIFDYEYFSEKDSANSKKRAACDVKRANRAAERYINGQRGLNLEQTAKSCLLESLPESVQDAESIARWRRAGVYAGLNSGAYVQDTTMRNVHAVLSFLNISGRALDYVLALSRGMNESQVAARFGVSRQAVNKSIKATAKKARAALDAADYTPTGTAADRAAALNRARADAAAAAVKATAPTATEADRADYAKKQAAAALIAMREYRAANSAHSAPLYMSDYETMLFRPDIAAALNSVSRVLLDIDAADRCADTYARRRLQREYNRDSIAADHMRAAAVDNIAADRAAVANRAAADRDSETPADRAASDSFYAGQRADHAAAVAVAAAADSLKKATEKRRAALVRAADRAAAALATATAADNGTPAAAAIIQRRQRAADRAAAALSEYDALIDAERKAAADRAAADRAAAADRDAADRARAAVRAENAATMTERAAAAYNAAVANRDSAANRAAAARETLTAAATAAAAEYAAAVAALNNAADSLTAAEKLALRNAVRAAADKRDRAAAALDAAALIVA